MFRVSVSGTQTLLVAKSAEGGRRSHACPRLPRVLREISSNCQMSVS